MQVRRIDLGDDMPAPACGEGPPLVWLGGLPPASGVDRPALRRVSVSSVAPSARERTVVFVRTVASVCRAA